MSDGMEIYEPQLPEVTTGVSEYLKCSIAESTRRVYNALWRGFETWCKYYSYRSLPAGSEVVAAYFAHIAREGRKAATVNSVRAAIRLAHQSAGYPDPTDTIVCKQTLKGIRRVHGTASVQKAATLPPDIRAMVDTLPQETLIGKRDRAVILLGFFTASRRSELVSLTTDDIIETEEGLQVTIRKSKTDQEAQGLTKAVTRQSWPPYCAVRAVRIWMESAGITSGPIFRSVAKG
ncbi:MAG: hypothetical protein ACYC0V_13745, partial [Armatimonadota bacterium]